MFYGKTKKPKYLRNLFFKMTSFFIKTNNIKVIDYIINALNKINFNNIIFSKKEFSKYTNIILHYVGNDLDGFYNEISNILCHCILDIYEPIIIRNTILLEYFYFDILDIEIIEQNCYELLQENQSTFTAEHFTLFKSNNHYEDREGVLWTEILKYITSHKSIVLDGFVKFRLKKYLQYIEDVIDNAVNQFVIDKEYNDFIKLIKMYIDSKPSSKNTVYLIYDHGESTLLDENDEVINCNRTILDASYLSDISFSSNDYTLNSLLSILPKKLIIRLLSPEDEFIHTLKLIFENRVIIKEFDFDTNYHSSTKY